MQEFDASELMELAEAAIEGSLSPAQRLRLESLVISNARAAQHYAEYVSLHATLQITRGNPLPHRQLKWSPIETNPSSSLSNRVWPRISLSQATVFAVLLTTIIAGVWVALSKKSPTIAKLTETKGCKWGPGTLPTEIGADLTAGRLRLEEGLARFVFSNGVDLQLESPADLEFISPMKCVLRSGKLVSLVPPHAKGFVVETPTSVVTDFGTEFGVSVGTDQLATVHVFQGRVDTLHRRSGQTEVMQEGSMYFFGASDFGPLENAERSANQKPLVFPNSDSNWIHITTAQGRGRDAFVQVEEDPEDKNKHMLLLKRPPPNEARWERRAYLGFDLSDLEAREVAEAELNLAFSTTGLGFASLVPDATFQVYGLIDGEHDDWQETELNWENAPACRRALEPLEGTLVKLLGTFVMRQGDESSTATISGVALRDFLNSDTNRLATLIVVRETPGRGGSSLVHGFASQHHPSLPPPTLRLLMKE